MLKNLSYWADMGGFTSEIDSMYNSYEEGFKDLDVKAFLAGKLQTLELLKPGMEAPNIVGTLIDGSPFSLAELRGKMVFVDVWATWCGPCIREMPYLEKIKTKLSVHENIVFLNVSVDKDIDAWKKYLHKDGGLKGININNDGSVYQQYNFFGVPKYLLIDKAGKIYHYDPERPSSGRLLAQPKRSLEEQETQGNIERM